MNLRRLAWRSWFYFRMGYGTYLALLIGLFSNIIVIYKLALASDPFLLSLFPHLIIFTLFSVPVGGIIGVLIGYLHTKSAMRTDIKIGTEISPYNHLAIPGKEKDVILPLLVALAKNLPNRPVEAIEKAERLLKGESIG